MKDPKNITYGTRIFWQVPSLYLQLFVPKGTTNDYKTTEPWSAFRLIEELEDETSRDLNDDGTINVGDVATLYELIMGGDSSSKDCDLNGDGVVNVGDVATLYDEITATEQ